MFDEKSSTRPGRMLLILCLPVLLSAPMSNLQAKGQRTLLDCSQIENDAERLACYDEIARRKSGEAAPAIEPADGMPARSSADDSYLSQLWELNKNEPRGQYAFTAHRSTYILPFTYNSSPNERPIRDATDQAVRETEVTFQLSQKVKLWQDVLDKDMDLWFGYTQRSFWQLYNSADSAPFRETNYEPEVLLNFRTDVGLLGMKARILQVGFNHQSNGRSEPLSRSWNRIVGNVGFDKDNFTLLVKTWYRIPESAEEDDNRDIDDYMGPGELWGYYFWNKHRFGMMLRNNLRSHDNRGALQLEWSFPLVRRVSGYIQYFNGYGESLVDYNDSTNRIGIGFILRDWN